MNRPQKVVVLIGVVVVAGMLLVPPWQQPAGSILAAPGYRFLFARIGEAQVDISRLAVQCAVVAVLAFGACVALSRKDAQ